MAAASKARYLAGMLAVTLARQPGDLPWTVPESRPPGDAVHRRAGLRGLCPQEVMAG